MRRLRKTTHRLTAALALAAVLFTTSTQIAHAELEDWATTFGLVEKYGNDEDGYFIYGKGDVDSSCLDYEKPFNLMESEIQFRFEAHPFNEYYTETWAYLAISKGTDGKKWLTNYTYEQNQADGRIEFLMEQHSDGSMTLCHYQYPVNVELITVPDFDYEAVHTISFAEKAMGTYVVFDGMALGSVDLTPEMEQHIGENAGSSYLRVGGLQQFEFEHLKINKLETQPDTKPTQPDETKNPTDSNKPSKLGDLAGKDKPSDEDNKAEDNTAEVTGFSILWVWAIVLAVVIFAAVVTMIILIIRRHKNAKEEK